MVAPRKPAETYGTTTLRPPDFDSFWEAIQDEAREIPLNPSLRHVPQRSTPEVDVYEIHYDSLDNLSDRRVVLRPKRSSSCRRPTRPC